MCPDHKLSWFKNHSFSTAKIRDIKKLVVKHWNETYELQSPDPPVVPLKSDAAKVSHKH